MRKHFRFTTAPTHLPADPGALDQVLDMLGGPGMLVYASDYPHDHGDGLPALLDRVSDSERRELMWGGRQRNSTSCPHSAATLQESLAAHHHWTGCRFR